MVRFDAYDLSRAHTSQATVSASRILSNVRGETLRGLGMRLTYLRSTKVLTAAASALALSASGALAGGFEVREQSTFFQGMSFAGAAAQGDSLSSMFWNPAAAAMAGPGLTTESNFALILPKSDVRVDRINGAPVPGAACAVFDCEVDIGRDAIVPASYLAWRYDSKTVFALGMNSQYGLGTKPDNHRWIGDSVSRSAKLFSMNITPTVSYELMPGVTIGAGLQIQYLDVKRLKSDVNPVPGALGSSANLEGSDLAVGFTLGVNFKPTATTSIGIGYRSSIDHELDGSLTLPFPGAITAITADVETPDKVTASLRQEIGSNMRLLATVEWTNWSKLTRSPIVGSAALIPGGATLEFDWDDGWFFALGGEYDVNDKLTLRAGGAYEISPIDQATSRLTQLPDADRIWASIGATYAWNEMMSFDFAYSHVFVDDARFARTPTANANPTLFEGSADSSVDIISVGLKMKMPPLDNYASFK